MCSLSAEAAPSRSASDGPDCRAFEARCAPTPADVQALNEGFSPSPAEVEQAHRAKEAVKATVQGGQGAVALADGTVADLATFRHSQSVLEFAAAIRAREARKALPSPA